jgi:mono/diheme cytochrome c family protein
MKLHLSIVSLSLFIAGIALSAHAQEQPAAKALFEGKCSLCHGTNRATSKKKSADGWNKTVSRMARIMEKKGKGRLSDAEITSISDYLARNYGK